MILFISWDLLLQLTLFLWLRRSNLYDENDINKEYKVYMYVYLQPYLLIGQRKKKLPFSMDVIFHTHGYRSPDK